MAVTVAAQLVTLGPPSPAGEADVALVAAALAVAGLPIGGRVFIDDDEALLEHALGSGAPLTVVLSGPAPSGGDTVRRVLARAAQSRLVLNDRMLGALEERYRREDRPLPRHAERLALLPQGATVWKLPDAEPAWMMESGGHAFVVLGRGRGLAATVEHHLVPFLAGRLAGRPAIALRTLRTAGIPLAALEERLADVLGNEGDVGLTLVPIDGDVWVRLRARGATPAAAAEALAPLEAHVATVLGPDCYGRDDESLERVVGRLLLARALTVSLAESCTGGLVGHRLTSVPGSSAWFERGVVVYSNRAKQELLRVSEAILRVHGAVSAPCAEAMARGISEASGSACGLAITGIAGPDGGTPQKPVGTVFVGLAVSGRVSSRRFELAGDRASVKWQSSQVALDMLRRRLEEAW